MMKLAALNVGDIGRVIGESGEQSVVPNRRTVVVEMPRTGRLHEIECQDLVIRTRPRK